MVQGWLINEEENLCRKLGWLVNEVEMNEFMEMVLSWIAFNEEEEQGAEKWGRRVNAGSCGLRFWCWSVMLLVVCSNK